MTLPNPFPGDDSPGDSPALRLVTDQPPEEVTDEADVSEVIRTPAPPVRAPRPDDVAALDNAVDAMPAPGRRPVAGPISYFATGITVAGHLALAGAAHIGDPSFPLMLLIITVWTICGLLTMCAEMIPRAIENRRIEEAAAS